MLARAVWMAATGGRRRGVYAQRTTAACVNPAMCGPTFRSAPTCRGGCDDHEPGRIHPASACLHQVRGVVGESGIEGLGSLFALPIISTGITTPSTETGHEPMTERCCAQCNRTGTIGFVLAEDGRDYCANGTACRRRLGSRRGWRYDDTTDLDDES